MIDRELKRCIGQMAKSVQVVGAAHEGTVRAYCSHWVSQISFEEPIMLCSVSPKHDTFPVMEASGRFSVSILAGDQVEAAQYFSYPGHKFKYMAPEYLEMVDGLPVVRDSIAWLACDIFDRIDKFDHVLFFARVTAVGEGRLGDPPLVYSSRHGWRIADTRARESGTSVRDALMERLAAFEQAQSETE
ncbi:MAG: flavin reductase family protein [Actinomycetota bacterium]